MKKNIRKKIFFSNEEYRRRLNNNFPEFFCAKNALKRFCVGFWLALIGFVPLYTPPSAYHIFITFIIIRSGLFKIKINLKEGELKWKFKNYGPGRDFAGLTKPGLRKPGLQNGRVGRPGPVPIPGYDPPKYNFQSRIIKFLASSIRISLFVAIIMDDDN